MIPHLSYSQYNTYTKCPREWYLSKVQKAEERQTWYIPIGTTVHTMIEYHLGARGLSTLPMPKIENIFYPLIEEQMEIEPDLSKWLAGGPADDPITEERALKRAQECFDKALTFLDDVEVWAVEHDASGRLPNLDVPIKAYVDLVGEHEKKGPIIYDWKTGSTKPNNFQLETYAALYKVPESEYAGVNFHGRYAMLAPGSSNTRFVDLSEVDPISVGAKYQNAYNGMKAKLYEAKAGFNCRFCFHAPNCLAEAGPTERAVYYDRSAEDGFPF